MKRLAVPLLLLLSLGATSCVREYTCQCQIKYTGQPGLPDSTMKEYPIRDTKEKARDLCKGNSQEASTTGGITTVETCDLY
jgi:hypothetical protein